MKQILRMKALYWLMPVFAMIIILQTTATDTGVVTSETGTYTLSGKNISLTEPSGVILHWNISSITQTQMVLVDNTDSNITQTWYFSRMN
jgi:phage gp45-like